MRGEYLKLDRALEDNRDEIAEVVEDGGVDRFEETLNAMEGLRQGGANLSKHFSLARSGSFAPSMPS